MCIAKNVHSSWTKKNKDNWSSKYILLLLQYNKNHKPYKYVVMIIRRNVTKILSRLNHFENNYSLIIWMT